MKNKKEFILFKDNGDKINILWNDYNCHENNISILDYLEKNSELIKKSYIALIESIAFHKINGQKVHEVFLIEKNFSYWWITDVYEKSLYKHSSINETLKMLALEEIIKENKVTKILIKNFCEKIFKSVEQLCKVNKILLEGKSKKSLNLKKILIFNIVFSFLNFLRFIIKRMSFTKSKINKKNIKNLFCSYFAYIDYAKLKKNLYHSEYWGSLLSEKNKIIKESHFLHIFFPTKNISYTGAIKAIQKINNNTNNKHFFIEESFTIRIFYKIIKYWIINIFRYLKYRKSIQNFLTKKNSLIWYFLKDELEEDFCGTSLLINMYYFYLFKELSTAINTIDKTFFLYENQGWEKSFVFNFKKKKNNKIIGVQHSTVRYWDLRYNVNIDQNETKVFSNFYPDYYAVNGDDSLIKLVANGYTHKTIKKVEAARYENVLKKMNSNNIEKNNTSSILIAGDYSIESNLNMASSLNNLDNRLISKFNFILKEHPLREMSNLLNFQFTKSLESIDILKNKYQYAIVSNTTSAAVDLYLLGFKLIVIVDKYRVNLSPLKDNKDIIFLYDQNLLPICLDKLSKIDKIENEKKNFFYYSPNYDLWNSLINE